MQKSITKIDDNELFKIPIEKYKKFYTLKEKI